MTKHWKFSKSMIESFNFQLTHMPTGFAHASSRPIPDLLFLDQMIALSSFGTSLRSQWLRALMTMNILLTQWSSTLMALASLAVALTSLLKSGTSAARDCFSTMMRTKMQLTRLLSTLTAAIFCPHRMTQRSRFGTWDKVIFFTLCMVMRAHRQQSISHLVAITSALPA